MFQPLHKAIITYKHKHVKEISVLYIKLLLIKKDWDLMLFIVQTMMYRINTDVPPRE
jgi:hypothetical protein